MQFDFTKKNQESEDEENVGIIRMSIWKCPYKVGEKEVMMNKVNTVFIS
jgi:hypothetical protein